MLSDSYFYDESSKSGLKSLRSGKDVGVRMRTPRPTLEEAISVRDLMLEGLYV